MRNRGAQEASVWRNWKQRTLIWINKSRPAHSHFSELGQQVHEIGALNLHLKGLEEEQIETGALHHQELKEQFEKEREIFNQNHPTSPSTMKSPSKRSWRTSEGDTKEPGVEENATSLLFIDTEIVRKGLDWPTKYPAAPKGDADETFRELMKVISEADASFGKLKASKDEMKQRVEEAAESHHRANDNLATAGSSVTEALNFLASVKQWLEQARTDFDITTRLVETFPAFRRQFMRQMADFQLLEQLEQATADFNITARLVETFPAFQRQFMRHIADF